MPKSKKKKSTVELGYAEEIDPEERFALTSPFFPSKIGGKPAWLTLDNLPEPLFCDICSQPLVFLLQVYAPLASKDTAFHRTVFVFICRDPACFSEEEIVQKTGPPDLKKSGKNPKNGNSDCAETTGAEPEGKIGRKLMRQGCIKAIRSQCSRENRFYPPNPLDPDLLDEAGMQGVQGLARAEDFTPLCRLCGSRASVKCNQCANRDYCSQEHAAIDWAIGHQHECGKPVDDEAGAKEISSSKKSSSKKSTSLQNQLLCPEFDLATEREGPVPPAKTDEERPLAERMKEYEEFVKKYGSSDPEIGASNSLDALEAEFGSKLDKFFKNFQRRVAAHPQQVLRYDREGPEGPLWASGALPPTPVPPCGACGVERVFEFQIMPHLLGVIGVDSIGQSIDFATVAVFTCKDSCDAEQYVDEFVWRQNFA